MSSRLAYNKTLSQKKKKRKRRKEGRQGGREGGKRGGRKKKTKQEEKRFDIVNLFSLTEIGTVVSYGFNLHFPQELYETLLSFVYFFFSFDHVASFPFQVSMQVFLFVSGLLLLFWCRRWNPGLHTYEAHKVPLSYTPSFCTIID
jgi:hypothetical protein